MSRSMRKIARYGRNNQFFKRLANKKARKVDVPDGASYKRVGVSSYDICDWKALVFTRAEARSIERRSGRRYLLKGYAK